MRYTLKPERSVFIVSAAEECLCIHLCVSLAREHQFFQDTEGGAPSLLGPSFDGGGSALLRSFPRRREAGLITYITAIKINATIIRKKLIPPLTSGRLGRSVHSLSLQCDCPCRSNDNSRRIAISWLQKHSQASNSSAIVYNVDNRVLDMKTGVEVVRLVIDVEWCSHIRET